MRTVLAHDFAWPVRLNEWAGGEWTEVAELIRHRQHQAGTRSGHPVVGQSLFLYLMATVTPG